MFAFTSRLKIFGGCLSLAALLILSSTVLAASPNSHSENNHAMSSSDTSSQSGQLKACRARGNAIRQRSTHLVETATGMEVKFSTIAQRIEDYYASKVSSSGKIISDYGILVADIHTRRTAVDDGLSKASKDVRNFNCMTNPKQELTQYRIDMQNVIQALKDYRTSIKNLIVAVRSANGRANSGKSSSVGTHPASPSAQTGRSGY